MVDKRKPLQYKNELQFVLLFIVVSFVVLGVYLFPVQKWDRRALLVDISTSQQQAQEAQGALETAALATPQHDCSLVSLDRPSFPLRAKLMIIIMETTDRIGRQETAHVVDNFKQYCSRHGYLFKLHHFEADPTLGVFGTRWREAFKFWHMADWLLMVDSDTLVGNLDRPMDPFLDGDEHVLLHWRPNREVTAAAVALRTTEYGRCFIDRWLGVLQTQRMRNREINGDNGALLLLITEILDPELARKCAEGPRESFDLIRCYEDVVSHFGDIPTPDVPIKIFPLLAGFWRQHEDVKADLPSLDSCYNEGLVRDMMFRRCWSNDILMSGWKEIGANMWPSIGSQNSKAKCVFNTEEDELRFAQLCCMHHFHRCSSVNGTNICKEEPWCSKAGDKLLQARRDHGFGVCRFVDYDTRWKLPGDFPSCQQLRL